MHSINLREEQTTQYNKEISSSEKDIKEGKSTSQPTFSLAVGLTTHAQSLGSRNI